jgi:hypothetical protein
MVPAWLKRVFRLNRYSFNLEQHRKDFERSYSRPISANHYNSGASHGYEFSSNTNGYSYDNYYTGDTINSYSTDDHHHSHHHCIHHDVGSASGANSTCATGDSS